MFSSSAAGERDRLCDVLERSFERDRKLTHTAHGRDKRIRIRYDGARRWWKIYPVARAAVLLMCALRPAQGEFSPAKSAAALPVYR